MVKLLLTKAPILVPPTDGESDLGQRHPGSGAGRRRACPSSSHSTTRAALTTCMVAAMYSRRDSPLLGGTKIEALVRSSLSMSSAS